MYFISFAMVLLAVVGRPVEVQQHVWATNESCAYSMIGYEQNAGYKQQEAFVHDIREILDHRGRAIGVLYVLGGNRYAMEGNGLMTPAVAKRFQLKRLSGDSFPWTTIQPVNPARIPFRVVPCRSRDVVKASAPWRYVLFDARKAWFSGLDHTPDPHVDLYCPTAADALTKCSLADILRNQRLIRHASFNLSSDERRQP